MRIQQAINNRLSCTFIRRGLFVASSYGVPQITVNPLKPSEPVCGWNIFKSAVIAKALASISSAPITKSTPTPTVSVSFNWIASLKSHVHASGQISVYHFHWYVAIGIYNFIECGFTLSHIQSFNGIASVNSFSKVKSSLIHLCLTFNSTQTFRWVVAQNNLDSSDT